jgi:hypothetical protein
MKKIGLLLILLFSYGSINSSALKECSVKAKFIDEKPNPTNEPNLRILQIEILSAKFTGGHSAGTKCDLLVESQFTISLKTNSKKEFKNKEILNLIQTKVYYHDSEGKPKSSETWELKD